VVVAASRPGDYGAAFVVPPSRPSRPKRRTGLWAALACALGAALAAVALIGASAEAAGPALAPPGLTLNLPGPLGGLIGRDHAAPPRPSRSPPSRCRGVTSSGRVPYAGAVFPCDFPDPMVLKVGRVWYAYATGTGWQPRGHVFPVLRSRDMRHWTRVSDGMLGIPGWAYRDVWAPSVVRARGRYFMYYSGLRRTDNVHCVAVASSRSPVGPFHTENVIGCHDRQGEGYIDAAPLIDRGRAYLYFSVDWPHTLSVLRLRRDLVHAEGPRKALLGPTRRWQKGLDDPTVEAPAPVRHGRLYYLFYSAGSWLTDYRMGYAVARSPTGPFRDYGRNPFLSRRPLVGPGGGAVVAGPGHTQWLAFHAWTGGPGYGSRHGERTLRMAPLRWGRHGVSVDVRGGPR